MELPSDRIRCFVLRVITGCTSSAVYPPELMHWQRRSILNFLFQNYPTESHCQGLRTTERMQIAIIYHRCGHLIFVITKVEKGKKNQVIICDKPVVISFLFLRFDFKGGSKKCWVVDTFRKNNSSTTITHGSKHFCWPWRSDCWCSADVPRNHSWLTNLRQKIERGKFASIDFVFLLKSTEVTWKRRRPDTSCLIFYWLWQSSPSISSSLQSPLSSSHLILTVSFQLKFLNY